MLQIIQSAGQIPLDFDRYYIQEEYNGIDSLGFTLPLNHPAYSDLAEESPVIDTETKQRYLIKAVDEGAQTVNIKAEIDLDGLRSNLLLDYTNGSATVYQTVTGVLPPGWSAEDHAYISARRTVEAEAGTPLGIIQSCCNVYGVTVRYDNAAKVVHIWQPEQAKPVGVFLTDELNLKDLNFKGKSEGFATRLYARGKEGMTFADINDGADYVENHTYSGKTVCAYWRDERYTIPENLLTDAKKRLASMAVPQRTYECNVIDLARATEHNAGAEENIYAFLDLQMYTAATLLDRRRGQRIDHQVVRLKRWPHYPEDNVVTLSTVAPQIQNTVKHVQEQITRPNSDFRAELDAAIAAATELISGALGGNFVILKNPDTGKPYGWAIMDTDNPETARDVWAFTAGGMGHSSQGLNGPFEDVAITKDGKINADKILTGMLTANLIRTGRIQSFNGRVYLDLDSGEAAVTKLTSPDGTASAVLKGYTAQGGDLGKGISVQIDGKDMFKIGGFDYGGYQTRTEIEAPKILYCTTPQCGIQMGQNGDDQNSGYFGVTAKASDPANHQSFSMGGDNIFFNAGQHGRIDFYFGSNGHCYIDSNGFHGKVNP